MDATTQKTFAAADAPPLGRATGVPAPGESGGPPAPAQKLTAGVEFAILCGLTLIVFLLAGRFDWFEFIDHWIRTQRAFNQLDELILAARFFAVGLLVFSFRRWRDSVREIAGHRHAQAELGLLKDQLEFRVKWRTAELNQSNDALRLQSAALTAAANAIVITNRDGTVVWVNPAFATLTGYTLAEAVGKNPRDLVKSGRQERAVYEEMWATILAGRIWHGQLVNRRKDGTCYPEEQTITPVREASGEITHFIAIKHDLTKRAQAEAARRASEERYRSLFENMAEGFAYCEMLFDGDRPRDFVYLAVNESFEKLTGLKDAVGRKATELVPGIRESDPGLFEIYGRVARGGAPERFEIYVEGLKMWFAISVYCPSPNHFVAVFDVVTERKQAEKALQLFRTLVDQSNDTIEVVDPASARFLDVNEAGPAELGCSRAEYLALRVFDIDPTIAESAWPQIVEKIHAAGSLRGEGRHRRKDGTSFPIEFSAKWVRLDRDYIVVVVRNTTERKLAERQMREQNEILSNSHEGVMIVNLANEVTLWNRGAEEIFGWTAAEALGRPPEQLLGVDELGVVSQLRAAVERDGFWNGELRGQTRDGRKLAIDSRITLVRDEAGQPRARLNFLADITEKKLLEEKFLHAQRLESLGMLASGVAHDLNNVLAPIVFAGPLLRDSLSTPRDLKILATLERSAARGTGLVKQILGFAHSTTGEFRPTQVKHIARDIVEMIEETFPKSIRLEHSIPSDLWPVVGNATQIHQILLNLCVNARDAMPAGGQLCLTVTNRSLDAEQARALPEAQPGAWLEFEVTDTGTGIAPDALAHIWEPFFTTKGAGKGTGLGLSTVRGIVASHHGFVALESTVGHGTTFRVFLPACLEGSAQASGVSDARAPLGQHELVLVVDDDKAIRETVSAILTKHRYKVLAASDGVEAVDHFTKHAGHLALVVTDVDMPLLGGAALARILGQLRPDLPLLVISGLASEARSTADIAAAKKIARAFLPKPFTADTLLTTVHQLLHPAPTT